MELDRCEVWVKTGDLYGESRAVPFDIQTYWVEECQADLPGVSFPVTISLVWRILTKLEAYIHISARLADEEKDLA